MKRIVDEATSYGFPTWTRGFGAFTVRGRIVEKGTNVPVIFKNVAVEPGDYVLADQSGIVFIRAAEIGTVLDASKTIVAKEAAMSEAIHAGTPMSAVTGGSYEHMLRE